MIAQFLSSSLHSFLVFGIVFSCRNENPCEVVSTFFFNRLKNYGEHKFSNNEFIWIGSNDTNGLLIQTSYYFLFRCFQPAWKFISLSNIDYFVFSLSFILISFAYIFGLSLSWDSINRSMRRTNLVIVIRVHLKLKPSLLNLLSDSTMHISISILSK